MSGDRDTPPLHIQKLYEEHGILIINLLFFVLLHFSAHHLAWRIGKKTHSDWIGNLYPTNPFCMITIDERYGKERPQVAV